MMDREPGHSRTVAVHDALQGVTQAVDGRGLQYAHLCSNLMAAGRAASKAYQLSLTSQHELEPRHVPRLVWVSGWNRSIIELIAAVE